VSSKSYRPKADAGENLSVDINIPDTATGGRTLSISSWPYETSDPAEQEVLEAHPFLTDRPEPKSKGD
jgi:hypothetical protein